MKNYKVNVHFEGSVDFCVEAENEEQAEVIAEELFCNLTPGEITGYRNENIDVDFEIEES